MRRRRLIGREAIPGGRDATVLLAARVLMSSQRALVGVVVTIYLARLGFSALRLAVLFAVVAVCSTLMSAGIGFAADRIGRKPFLIILPLLTAACGVVYMVTTDMAALFTAAALGSFGRGSGAGGGQIGPYTPAEQALLAGMVSNRDRPRLFGLIASASALGGLVGALLVALPTGHAAAGPVGAGTYRLAFGVAAGLALCAGLLALPVREPALPPHEHGVRHPRLTPHSRGLVLRLWATNATNGVAVGLFGPFVTYWFYTRFGAGTEEIGTLYVVINVVTFFTNFLAAPTAGRFGVVRTVVVARCIQGLLLIPMAVSPWFPLAGGVYLLRMMAQRFGMAMRQSFVMSAATPRDRARVAAYAALPTQGLSAVAPTATGYLFDEVSLSLPFELAGGLQVINALLFYTFFHNFAPPPGERPPGEQSPQNQSSQGQPPEERPAEERPAQDDRGRA